MKNKKIGPLDFLLFLVVVVIFVLVSITCEKKFDLQKVNDEQIINIDNYKNQTNILQAKIFDLQKKNDLLTTEKNKVIEQIQKTTNENQTTNKQIQKITKENETLTKENQRQSNNLNSLIKKINGYIQIVALASDLGLSKSEEEGINPIFQLKLESVEQVTQENYLELSRGSYQRKKEVINFNIDNLNSWKDLGSWRFTGYTATVEECDSSPSITANNSLVTPGFTLAVDPAFWSYGTIFYIDGFGFAIAADSGSAIKGKNRGDILVSDKKFSAHLTGQRNVWLVYSPPTSPKK